MQMTRKWEFKQKGNAGIKKFNALRMGQEKGRIGKSGENTVMGQEKGRMGK